MTEKRTVTDPLIKRLNNRPDTTVWKRFSGRFGNKGKPDITGVVNLSQNGIKLGVRVEIECKALGKKPTKIQAKYLKDFKELNCVCFWTDDYKTGLLEFERQISLLAS